MGAISAGLLGHAVQNRLNATQFMNGCLGGLVAIIAGAFAVTTPVAALIGFVGVGLNLTDHGEIEDFDIPTKSDSVDDAVTDFSRTRDTSLVTRRASQ